MAHIHCGQPRRFMTISCPCDVTFPGRCDPPALQRVQGSTVSQAPHAPISLPSLSVCCRTVQRVRCFITMQHRSAQECAEQPVVFIQRVCCSYRDSQPSAASRVTRWPHGVVCGSEAAGPTAAACNRVPGSPSAVAPCQARHSTEDMYRDDSDQICSCASHGVGGDVSFEI